MHESLTAFCNWSIHQYHLHNSRGNIVSGLVSEKKAQEGSHPKCWSSQRKTASATCNWLKQKYYLQNGSGTTSAGWSLNVGRGKALTSALSIPQAHFFD